MPSAGLRTPCLLGQAFSTGDRAWASSAAVKAAPGFSVGSRSRPLRGGTFVPPEAPTGSDRRSGFADGDFTNGPDDDRRGPGPHPQSAWAGTDLDRPRAPCAVSLRALWAGSSRISRKRAATLNGSGPVVPRQVLADCLLCAECRADRGEGTETALWAHVSVWPASHTRSGSSPRWPASGSEMYGRVRARGEGPRARDAS